MRPIDGAGADRSAPPNAVRFSTTKWRCIAAVICATVGLGFSTLPHLLWWPRLGHPAWMADKDEIIYTAVAAHAYFNHPLKITDPLLAGNRPTMYPWLDFVPAVLALKALRLPPIEWPLIVRIWAGLSLGLGWYYLCATFLAATPRHETEGPEREATATEAPWGPGWTAWVLAPASAIFLLLDAGVEQFHPLVRQFALLATVAAQRTGPLLNQCYPKIFPGWRILSPAAYLAFLLVHVALVAAARRRPTWRRIGLAGISLGALFYVYFFLWTAVLGGMALAWIADAGHRHAYLRTLSVGIVIGLPAIASGARFKHELDPGWSLRNSYFAPAWQHGPMHAGNVLAFGALLLWTLWIGRDLLYLLAVALASWLLFYFEPLATGLEIQNFHWLNVRNPLLSALLLFLIVRTVQWAIAGRRLQWTRAATAAVLAMWGIHAATGFGLRVIEARGGMPSLEFASAWEAYEQQSGARGAPALEPGAVLGGDGSYEYLSAITANERPLAGDAALLSPWISNADWIARTSLDVYLSGATPAMETEVFQRENDRFRRMHPDLDWVVNPARWNAYVAAEREAFAAISANPTPVAERYGVRYVALPAREPKPAYLSDGWAELQTGPYWQVWERDVAKGTVSATRAESLQEPKCMF
jgi:hypothetical protein